MNHVNMHNNILKCITVSTSQQSRFSKCDICTKFDQERIQTGGRCGFIEEYNVATPQSLTCIAQVLSKHLLYNKKKLCSSDPVKPLIYVDMDNYM